MDEPRMTPRMEQWIDYIRKKGKRIPVHGTDVIVLNRLVRYEYLEYFNKWYIPGPRLNGGSHDDELARPDR